MCAVALCLLAFICGVRKVFNNKYCCLRSSAHCPRWISLVWLRMCMWLSTEFRVTDKQNDYVAFYLRKLFILQYNLPIMESFGLYYSVLPLIGIFRILFGIGISKEKRLFSQLKSLLVGDYIECDGIVCKTRMFRLFFSILWRTLPLWLRKLDTSEDKWEFSDHENESLWRHLYGRNEVYISRGNISERGTFVR